MTSLAATAPRILLVEDERDVRDTIGEFLEEEGYEVTCVATAADGLERLRDERYNLVVSDYNLPDQTGVAMLHEANTRGDLGSAQVIIVTAHPNPIGTAGFRVLQKPIDIDNFLVLVHGILAADRRAIADQLRAELEQNDKARTADGAARIELFLYVSGSAPSSLKALRNVQAVLSRYDRSSIRFAVHDLSRELPEMALEHRIAFTPTLVKCQPEPRIHFLGSLDDASVLVDLLNDAGVERKR
jgi:DNA-binding response OmpR family regulator